MPPLVKWRQKHLKTWTFSSLSLNPTFIRHLFFSVFLLFEHALKKDYRVTKVHHRKPLVLLYPLCCQQLIKKEVKTISEQKHPNVFGIKELLKTDNTENLVAIPKKMTVRTPRKNWKIFQIQTKKLMDKWWTIAYID